MALPAFLVDSPRVALQEPAGSFAMPVTALRFEPLADVEARNLAEAQADVTIRGGIFENTGFRLGASDLFDPQTGHYFAEMPVPPAMLSAPRILTGPDNAPDGFNANVGTIAYAWQRIRPRGELTAAGGQYGTAEAASTPAGTEAAGAGGFASAPTRPWRARFRAARCRSAITASAAVAVRLQLAGPGAQTDLFVGYQEKFFGWPNLYTPFNSDETENLKTVLVALNHRRAVGGRRLARGRPVLAAQPRRLRVQPFRAGRARASVPAYDLGEGAAVSGRARGMGWTLGFDAEALADDLRSTALIYGRFHTRTYVKLGVVPEKTWSLDGGRRLTVRTGATYDDTNRDGAALSPIAEVALAEGVSSRQRRLSLSYAQTTQVPTYTALDSNPAAGLFRGNPGLGRSTSRNFEFGADEARPAGRRARRSSIGATRNWWTGPTSKACSRGRQIPSISARPARKSSCAGRAARRARPRLHRPAQAGRLREPDHGELLCAQLPAAAADGGRGAPAWARLRAAHGQPGAHPGAQCPADGRRRSRGDLFAGLVLPAPRVAGLELSVQADNLWDSNFEEVPAVPAARREVSARTVYRW